MILSPHMIAGSAIASRIESYSLILILGVLVHFALDMLPHWDYLEFDLNKISAAKYRIFLVEVATDILAGIILIWLIFGLSSWQIIFWGAFCGALPDGMVFLNHLTKQKFLTLVKFKKFHDSIHFNTEINKKIPVWGRIFAEIVITAGAIMIIYFI